MIENKINSILDNESKEVQLKQLNVLMTETAIEFTTWIVFNYCSTKSLTSNESLPKGKWRKEFTNNVYTIDYLWIKFNESL